MNKTGSGNKVSDGALDLSGGRIRHSKKTAFCGAHLTGLANSSLTLLPLPKPSQAFKVGDQVIWLKRIPGGPYVYPVAATVLAITPKRIKLEADDDGQIVIRYVPPESLQPRT